MTARFDAFKAALHALCVEHGMRLDGDGEYEEWHLVLQDANDGAQGLGDVYIEDLTERTPEEKAAEQERRDREAAEWQARHEAGRLQWQEFQEAEARKLADLMESAHYLSLQSRVEEDAAEQRKEQMRISTDPADPSYIDARPRRVLCNDVPVENWAVADEFRRIVITAEGKVLHGSVSIERLADSDVIAAEEPPAVNAGFSGMFEYQPDAKPAPVAAPAPAPAAPQKKAAKRRR